MKNEKFIGSILLVTVLFWLTACSTQPKKVEPLTTSAINHVVLVWFKQGTTKAEVDGVIEQTQKLAMAIPEVKSMRLGRAIASERKIVDDSFDLGIYFLFADEQAMQRYLNHPQHVAFVKQWVKPKLAKLVVYDF